MVLPVHHDLSRRGLPGLAVAVGKATRVGRKVPVVARRFILRTSHPLRTPRRRGMAVLAEGDRLLLRLSHPKHRHRLLHLHRDCLGGQVHRRLQLPLFRFRNTISTSTPNHQSHPLLPIKHIHHFVVLLSQHHLPLNTRMPQRLLLRMHNPTFSIIAPCNHCSSNNQLRIHQGHYRIFSTRHRPMNPRSSIINISSSNTSNPTHNNNQGTSRTNNTPHLIRHSSSSISTRRVPNRVLVLKAHLEYSNLRTRSCSRAGNIVVLWFAPFLIQRL